MPSKQHLHCIYTYLTWPILNLPQALVLLALNSIILISYSFCSIFKHVLVLKQILHVHLFFNCSVLQDKRGQFWLCSGYIHLLHTRQICARKHGPDAWEMHIWCCSGGWMMGKQSEWEMGGRNFWGVPLLLCWRGFGFLLHGMLLCILSSPPSLTVSSLSFPLLCLYFPSSLTFFHPSLLVLLRSDFLFFSLSFFNKLTTKKNLLLRQLVLCCNSEKKMLENRRVMWLKDEETGPNNENPSCEQSCHRAWIGREPHSCSAEALQWPWWTFDPCHGSSFGLKVKPHGSYGLPYHALQSNTALLFEALWLQNTI